MQEESIEKKKRGPGRPRKNLVNPIKVLIQKSVVKRKLGRGRKIKQKGGTKFKQLSSVKVQISNSNITQISEERKEEVNSENISSKPLTRLRGRARNADKLNKSNSEDSPRVNEETIDLNRSGRLRRNTKVINYSEKRKKLTKVEKQETEKKAQQHGPSEYVMKSKAADEHIAKHMKLKCDVCNSEFLTFSKLLSHYRMIHKIRGFVTCCNKKFYKRILLSEHISKHLNPDYFRCEMCSKTFADRRCLKGHMMLMHESDELKIHKCDKCPRSYCKQYMLERHKLIHVPLEEREYVCDDCGKAFPSKNYLTSHIRSVHENAYGVMCHICAKVIQGKTLLQKHQLEHAGIVEPKLQCKECGSWLKNKYSLKKHMDRHAERYEELQNPQKNICDICGKVSPSKGALRSHIKYVHMSTRTHECTICMKSFKKAITLKEHMTTHTGEILYSCPYCPKTFNSSANMHSHRKKKHRIEWEENRRMKELEKERFKSSQEDIICDLPLQLPVEVVYGQNEAKSDDNSVDFGNKGNNPC